MSAGGVVNTVTSCATLPSQTPTPSPTAIPSGFGYIGGYGNATDACRGSAPTGTMYTSPGTNVIMVGTQFYNNSALTQTFPGNNVWYKVVKGGTTWAAYIDSSGIVQDYTDCTNIPSNPATPSQTPTPTITAFYYIMDLCSGGGTVIGRSLTEQALGATFEYSQYVCARITDTTSAQFYSVDIDASTYVGNSCGACPTPPPSPAPPTYTQFNDCNGSNWYILGDYSSGTHTSVDVPYGCLLAGFTTTFPSGTEFYNIAVGICSGCP